METPLTTIDQQHVSCLTLFNHDGFTPKPWPCDMFRIPNDWKMMEVDCWHQMGPVTWGRDGRDDDIQD